MIYKHALFSDIFCWVHGALKAFFKIGVKKKLDIWKKNPNSLSRSLKDLWCVVSYQQGPLCVVDTEKTGFIAGLKVQTLVTLSPSGYLVSNKPLLRVYFVQTLC